MSRLPLPTTFAEGQRALALWLMAGAGVFAGLVAVTMIALLVWGGWSPTQERLILQILGFTLGGFVIAMIVVILALAVGGPVGRFKVGASRAGATFEAEGDAAAVTTTTTTTTAAGAPPDGRGGPTS